MPADASQAHLLGRLAVVEARVRVAVARRRSTDPNPDDGFRGLYVAEEHVDRLLAREGTAVEAASADADRLAAEVEAAADAAAAAGEPLRLRRLARAAGLTALDTQILLVALAPDLEPRFEKLYGYLHDDVTRRRATIGLALELAGRSLLDPDARARAGATAPLRRHDLLTVADPDGPFPTRPLRVPDRVTAHLLGDDTPDPAVAAARADPEPLPTAQSAALARALRAGVTLAYLRQPAGCDAAAVAAAALAETGRPALTVDLGAAPDPERAAALARAAARDARLDSRALVAGPVDALVADGPGSGAGGPSLRALTTAAPPVVLFGGGPWDPGWSAGVPLVLDLERPDRRQQESLWARALAAGDGEAPTALEVLRSFRLGSGQIRRAVTAARAQASAGGSPLTPRHLAAGARAQNAATLTRLARHVAPVAGWDDLVLPAEPLESLRHLTARVAHRDRLLDDWGLRRGGGRGEAVTALFVGESGTGKTMAAEVIAGALGLDLYVIDLSMVVDKYVGETEKNLERVFAGAEGVNGVLFFDEADALFGKRSEVSDARDRYANVEVAYLLQRMESFDGLAVLATNLKANLDEAFTRRLSMVVDFPQPGVPERRRLWATSFAAVPLAADLDLDGVARCFPLAGGDIRNVAVTAAALAATDGQVVTMPALIRAVQMEYRKLGRLCTESEFGPYYPLLRSAVPSPTGA